MAKSKAPAQTLEEVNYLRRLVAAKIPVTVRLRDGNSVSGCVEYWDTRFIRLTRTKGPNLFIYKHDIAYLYENGEAGS